MFINLSPESRGNTQENKQTNKHQEKGLISSHTAEMGQCFWRSCCIRVGYKSTLPRSLFCAKSVKLSKGAPDENNEEWEKFWLQNHPPPIKYPHLTWHREQFTYSSCPDISWTPLKYQPYENIERSRESCGHCWEPAKLTDVHVGAHEEHFLVT